MVKNIVYLGILAVLFQKWFGFTPPSWVCILIGVSFEGACYLLGLLDERVGFWKFSNVYSATELSPFSNEMMERIKDIQKCQSTK